MFLSHLIALFFQYIPEEIVVVFVASVFLKINITRLSIICIGFILGLITYTIKLLPVSFGFHTFLTLIAMVIILSSLFRTNGFRVFIACLKTFIILAVIELITINTFLYLTGFTFAEINQKPIIRTIAILPQTIILFAVGLILRHFYNKRSQEG